MVLAVGTMSGRVRARRAGRQLSSVRVEGSSGTRVQRSAPVLDEDDLLFGCWDPRVSEVVEAVKDFWTLGCVIVYPGARSPGLWKAMTRVV